MSDWKPIETAPKDGSVIRVTHNRWIHGKFAPAYDACWGVGLPHKIDGYTGLDGPVLAKHRYVVNEGKPCWLDKDRRKMVATPTHWMPPEQTGAKT